MVRVAVIGHVEWVDFVRVARQPPRGGLAEGERLFEHAGGGAVVAAAGLAELGAQVDFFTALSDDARGERARGELLARGISVHAGTRPAPTRYVFTTLEDGGERTIVTVGERHAPRSGDGLDLDRLRSADGVYATAGDPALLAAAAATGALVITTRIGPAARYAGLPAPGIAAAVFSAEDPAETAELAAWEGACERLVATEGARGGRWWEGAGRPRDRGRWPAAPLPGPPRDSYGCGDAFAAGFTYGLASGESPGGAAAIGARCGAALLTRVGGP